VETFWNVELQINALRFRPRLIHEIWANPGPAWSLAAFALKNTNNGVEKNTNNGVAH
jgi:hypothetical protein